MNKKPILILIAGLMALTGCSSSTSTPPPPTTTVPPTLSFFAAETPSPITASTAIVTPTITPGALTVCHDLQMITLMDSLKTSMLTADGMLLSSLVSPNGMEVRYFHSSDPITYTADQAQFLFETTFEANWGTHPASGLEKTGAFHEVVVPELVKIFNSPYTLHCNEIKHGGASYPIVWPYDKDFYSIYYAGTEQNGFLDWLTWVVGVENVSGRPYIYALIQFFWEP